jgi:hypothetical protein
MEGKQTMEPNVVIDLPEHTAPEEAARLLNAPGDGYFLVTVLPGAGGHRAYLRKQCEDGEDREGS